jgi:predicted nucleic acid-binding protein
VVQPTDADAVRRLTQLLDSEEAEAIIVAQELQADRLLMDEKAGRQVAQNKGLPIIGLAGVLLLAKRRNLIPRVSEPLRELVEAGFYLDESIQREIRQLAGEL